MYLPPNSTEARRRACDHINGLSLEKPWTVTIKPYKKRRSLSQNSYYWGVVIRLIQEHTGHAANDLHDYLLGECFGWEEVKVFERLKRRPSRRTSDMTTTEFGNFIDWCHAWGSKELGLVIPLPNEIQHAIDEVVLETIPTEDMR